MAKQKRPARFDAVGKWIDAGAHAPCVHSAPDGKEMCRLCAELRRIVLDLAAPSESCPWSPAA